ncbi:uncharacterized protein [Temnothorax nylanderi]|uniref:uncharacterized protein isoform X1 n=1 Tax=Temnothorax nylanderi TaxID=102681 RepID=UPI003A86FA98
MDNKKYIIVEFDDGLQLIPAAWFNADTFSSIWPSHFNTKLRINKAIITREMPQQRTDWEEISIKKVFGTANTYAEGIEKLSLAEDTSNVDEAGISSNELREREKKRRRINAKKNFSSSSEDDVCSNKENKVTRVKTLPAFPQKQHFVSNDKKLPSTSTQVTRNVLCENTSFKTISRNDISDNEIVTNSNISSIKNSALHTEDENVYTHEFKKIILRKLNKILYKMETIEKNIEMFDKKVQYSNQPCIAQKSNIQFPIGTLPELTLFEEQLQDMKFKEDVLNTFYLVGGHSAHIMIRNIFKTAITDNFATQFTWTGKKNKRCFKDLGLSKLIIQAVRMSYKEMTENEFAEYASKWLAQATVRIARQKKEEKHSD